MAVDLGIDFCGVKLKNPFILASSHSCKPANFKKIADAGWAAGILAGSRHQGNGISEVYGTVPRETKFVDKPPVFWAYQNTCSSLGQQEVGPVSRAVELIEKDLLETGEAGIPVGVNLIGMEDPQDWVDQAVISEKLGAAFLECNFSCPYIPGVGLRIFGKEPEKAKPIVRAVKDNTSLPVIAKLNAIALPEDLANLAKDCIEGGADAISISNATIGFVGVDIETGMPLNAYVDINGKLRGSCSGISGPALKVLVLRAVAELYQTVDVPICAIGGISDWQTAVEYMMLGARTVQVGVASMLYGYRMVRGMIRGLEGFMERKGYKSIEDFVGYTNKKYDVGKPFTLAKYKQPRKMVVDEDKCTGCGLCISACEATAKGAMKVVDRVAVIDRDLCETCNSCMLVCPEGAISTKWEPKVLETVG